MNKNIPQSATSGTSIFIGALILVVSIFLTTKVMQISDIVISGIICGTAAITSFIIFDLLILKVHRRSTTGLSWQKSDKSISRSFQKYIGLLGTMICVGFLYWIFPEYKGEFYSQYWQLLRIILPFWVLLAFPYFYFIDSKQLDHEDGYFHAGHFFLLNFEKIKFQILGQHFLGWLVKGFFLPLMFTYFMRELGKFEKFELNTIIDFKTFFDFTYDFIFLIDVSVVSIGYLMSLKIFDSHIRSTEPTMLGWLVALVCYQPFWSLIGKQYVDYASDFGWGSWLSENPLLYKIWGITILSLYSIYVWSSLMFGLRFSNLTHRGIITNGPYRWTKHPAYISKNIAWWLISVPFVVNESLLESIRRCALLLLVNGIYYLRAKTEERHLGIDPVYIDYKNWINENGIFKKIRI